MDLNICNSISSLSILKFIIKSINNDIPDIKLIFVGPQIDKTKDILKKLENQTEDKNKKYNDSYDSKREDARHVRDASDTNIKYMHSILSSSENKYLEKTIPFYITKFGKLKDYKIVFIYKFIETNLAIEHVRIILYEVIKEFIIPITKQHDTLYLPTNMLLYKYPKTMSFKYLQLYNIIINT